jgi:5'-3' exonuclease
MIKKTTDKTPWLFFDCNYLCHRAFYSHEDTVYKGRKTGVIQGFLKEVLYSQVLFQTDQISFYWDYGENKRKEIYPLYKWQRKERVKSKAEKRRQTSFTKQITLLREKIIPRLGYKNNFYQDGFEGDDLIAYHCKKYGDIPIIVISSDSDLFQLINHNVSIYNPQKRIKMTLRRFKELYKINPDQWVFVKAIAGCTSDNIKGLQWVGEKTAIAYFNGALSSDCKKYKSIVDFVQTDKYIFNLSLVQLPIKGTEISVLKNHKTTKERWKKICKKYGVFFVKGELMFLQKKFWRKYKKNENILSHGDDN